MRAYTTGGAALYTAFLFTTLGAAAPRTFFKTATIRATPTIAETSTPTTNFTIQLTSLPPSLVARDESHHPEKWANFPPPWEPQVSCWVTGNPLYDWYDIYGKDWNDYKLHQSSTERKGRGLHHELKKCHLYSWHFEMLTNDPKGYEWHAHGKSMPWAEGCIEKAMLEAGVPAEAKKMFCYGQGIDDAFKRRKAYSSWTRAIAKGEPTSAIWY
ncbi:hypothetical protein MBLNU230_g6420t1 [Neophaeotheca triangularis]